MNFQQKIWKIIFKYKKIGNHRVGKGGELGDGRR